MGTPIFGTKYVMAPTPEGEEHPNVQLSDRFVRQETFCDNHCTWRDHHPDCALRTAAAEEANRRANAGWSLMCKKMVAAERDRCCRIIFGLCLSDNNAQEIVNKIRSEA